MSIIDGEIKLTFILEEKEIPAFMKSMGNGMFPVTIGKLNLKGLITTLGDFSIYEEETKKYSQEIIIKVTE